MAYTKRPMIEWVFEVSFDTNFTVTLNRTLTDREHPSHWAKEMARDGVRKDSTWFPGHRVVSVSWHRAKGE